MDNVTQSPAKPPILSEWLNYWVFVSYMAGPNLDANEPSKPVRDKPEAVTASFLLEDNGDLGIEVKRNPGDPTIFMSWGLCSTSRSRPRRCASRSTSKTPSGRRETAASSP